MSANTTGSVAHSPAHGPSGDAAQKGAAARMARSSAQQFTPLE
jgi:hypothetical protein